jgi:hypothetical protein
VASYDVSNDASYDGMPRTIIRCDKIILSKRIVKPLTNQVDTMEPDNAPAQRVYSSTT